MLPAHLDYEEAVEHCVDHLDNELASVGVSFDRAPSEALLRLWGLALAVDLLGLGLRENGKLKEWWAKRQIREVQSRLQKVSRFA